MFKLLAALALLLFITEVSSAGLTASSASGNVAKVFRRNFVDLTPQEHLDLQASFQKLKLERSTSPDEELDASLDESGTEWNTYDWWTWHANRAFDEGMVSESSVAFPWSRALLWQFEQELQRVSGNESMALPYWDPTDEARLSEVFSDSLLSTDTDKKDSMLAQWSQKVSADGRLITGSVSRVLAATSANESSDDDNDGSSDSDGSDESSDELSMSEMISFCTSSLDSALPTTQSVAQAVVSETFDAEPFKFSAQTSETFRQQISCMTKQVESFVGGDFSTNSGADDPTFWLYASFVDKLWLSWQSLHTEQAAYGFSGTVGLDDELYWFGDKVVDWVDITSLDYSYEMNDQADKLIDELVLANQPQPEPQSPPSSYSNSSSSEDGDDDDDDEEAEEDSTSVSAPSSPSNSTVEPPSPSSKPSPPSIPSDLPVSSEEEETVSSDDEENDVADSATGSGSDFFSGSEFGDRADNASGSGSDDEEEEEAYASSSSSLPSPYPYEANEYFFDDYYGSSASGSSSDANYDDDEYTEFVPQSSGRSGPPRRYVQRRFVEAVPVERSFVQRSMEAYPRRRGMMASGRQQVGQRQRRRAAVQEVVYVAEPAIRRNVRRAFQQSKQARKQISSSTASAAADSRGRQQILVRGNHDERATPMADQIRMHHETHQQEASQQRHRRGQRTQIRQAEFIETKEAMKQMPKHHNQQRRQRLRGYEGQRVRRNRW